MADPIISALVKDLVGRLTSAAIQEYGLLRRVKKDLLDLNNTFEKIQSVLYDAEKKTMQKDVEEWLKTLKTASLEVENVLDAANTEAMIRRLHREMSKNYKRAFFSSRYNPLMVRFRTAHKVKRIRKKLDEINADRSKFGLITSEDGAGIVSNRETTSPMPKIDIYGRDEEKKMIVDKICNQDLGIQHDNNDVRVYAIWGMGGIGKTTLAQMVYNDETVKKHFDLKCWVYVSSVFDVKQIIKAICDSEDSRLEAMQTCLQMKLRGKKFLIVMDDVWIQNKDMADWEELYKGLSCGAKGSTVLVTTREKDIAQRMAKIRKLQHNVGVLSDKDAWSLFKMLAFPGRGEAENISSELELIGTEIVQKCNGLPLAVKTLGSLMSTKERVDQWQLVNNNFMWEIQDNDILPALRISYDNLLPHWKRCFAYCCLFSKGEEMSKDLMIELWMANGFIPSKGDVSLYVLGEEIFDSLVGRSFFQDVVEKDIDTGETCKMHDLMHDLAQYVMRHDCAVIGPGKESRIPDKVLHLRLLCQDFEFLEQHLVKLRSVRSMLVFDDDYQSSIRQISSLVYLRVLYLNKIESSTLPESICKLIHLRYLKISRSKIKVLPESIINLQNLQTLILEECWSLRRLPIGLRYMRNLQRLDTRDCRFLQHMPVGIKELTNLRRLSQFVVGKDDGARIGELGNLNRLGWDLRLYRLENVRDLTDAKSSNLKDKTNLKSLILEWGVYHGQEISDSEEVLEGLEPNSGLQELTICNYVERVMSPSWMVKLVNLTSIKLHYHEICEQLPPLGKLRSLKRIELQHMRSLKCFHDDDYVTSRDGNILFPNLQKLSIVDCGLVSLPSNFPKLQSLELIYCPKLRSLPHEIQSFKDLNQITIHESAILYKRCQEGKGKDWAKISHIHDRNIQPSVISYYGDENEDTDDDSVNYRDEDSDENEDTDDDSVNYRDEDGDENEDTDDDSVNYRDEDSDENEDTDDDSVNYRDEDSDENEDKDDDSVNYRDEDSDENEDKDDDSVNYRDED